ncbi:hypothetical protein [Salinicola tamaricis]|uniref:hypothetical protein n=1 Tax=Salinicola tamaricis TaxID=1771309 RepID=UPI0013E9D499|nr:hypothetical protein [Salinicola tamaricis]
MTPTFAAIRTLRGELVVNLCRTFAARGVAALGTVMLGVVLGRLYGAQGWGCSRWRRA